MISRLFLWKSWKLKFLTCYLHVINYLEYCNCNSRATLRCFAGRMWPAGRTLPGPVLANITKRESGFFDIHCRRTVSEIDCKRKLSARKKTLVEWSFHTSLTFTTMTKHFFSLDFKVILWLSPFQNAAKYLCVFFAVTSLQYLNFQKFLIINLYFDSKFNRAFTQ